MKIKKTAEVRKRSAQLSFGDFSNRKKQEHLSKVTDVVNKKLGNNVVTIGVSSSQHKIKPIIAFVDNSNLTL